MKTEVKLYLKACWYNLKPVLDALSFIVIVSSAVGLALYSPLALAIVLVVAGLYALHRANMREYHWLKKNGVVDGVDQANGQ